MDGKLRTSFLSKAKPHVTRFVPGREGLGLTDRIDSTVNYMVKNQILVLDHNYGLWYERRRDDHERVRRVMEMCGGHSTNNRLPAVEKVLLGKD